MPRKSSSKSDAPQAGSETDEDLFARFTRGDEGAFADLVERYRDRAYWVAYNMIRDSDEALDLAQEAFARTFVAAKSFDVSQKFSTWFFRILSNLTIDVIRKRKIRKTVSTEDTFEVASESRGPGQQAHASDLREKVAQVLQTLPPNHRNILVLRDIQGLSNLEIADILGCTHATARWRLHRARARFREAWEKAFGEWEG